MAHKEDTLMVVTTRQYELTVLTEAQRAASQAEGWETLEEHPAHDLRKPRLITLRQRPGPHAPTK